MKPQTASLIDSIGEGFAAINRRPWLVGVPVLLNLYLWFGAQISLAPLLTRLRELMQRLEPASAPETGQSQIWQSIINSDMRVPLALLNFLRPAILAPTLVQPGLEGRPEPLYVRSFLGAVAVIVAINLVALLLTSLFFTTLAESVRGDRAPSPVLLRRIGRSALAVLGYVLAVIGVGLALGLPFLFFAGALLLLSPSLGELAVALLFVAGFWIYVYVGFAPEAIFVSGIGPLEAMRASFQIVRRNLWGTLGLLLLTLLISSGLALVWQMLMTSLPGLIVAIVGCAYIGSGLIAARMAFYRDRLRRWQQSLATSRPAS